MSGQRTRSNRCVAVLAMAVITASCGSASNGAAPAAESTSPSDMTENAAVPENAEMNDDDSASDTTTNDTDGAGPTADPTPGNPSAEERSDATAGVSIPATTDTPTTTAIAATPSTAIEEQVDGDPASASCRRLTDFDGGADDSGWVIVNDGVMGGRSNGTVEVSDSIMRFTGGVVTAGGGFTSVRYRLIGGEMADSNSLKLRVRADQRIYGVTLEDNAEVGRRSVSHRADFDTSGAVDADGWTEVTLDYSELTTSVFGQFVEAPPFDPDSAREIGIIIADGTDGEFALDVDWIDVCP